MSSPLSKQPFAAPRRDDGGYVMITVLGTMLVLSLLVTLTLTWSLNATKAGRSETDHDGALAAAQAGVDDYLSKLNANPTYYVNGAATGSATITGGASYAYQVTSPVSSIQSSGVITLKSTGTVRGESRSITVTLRKPSFLDYLYFTQYETIDPIATGGSAGTCSVFRYAGRDTSACPDIQFRTGDTLKGSVYSSDAISIAGNPSFQKDFVTGWDGCKPATNCGSNPKLWVDANGSGSAPSFATAPQSKTLPFPTTNMKLKDQAVKTNGGGCVYYGPTRIVFNSTGTMTVTSPYSGTANTGCGTFSTGSPTQTVNVPANNVIYVDSVPSGTATPNCTTPATVQNVVGFPITNDDALTSGNNKLVYGCRNGDAFVEGWLKGQVTLGSANNIIITNDLRYAGSNGSAVGTAVPTSGTASPNAADSSSTDVLGLSAANFVELYHPVKCSQRDGSGNCIAGSDVSSGSYPKANFQVDAVLVASADSFLVQSWDKGSPMNALTVLGGIIQFFRGPVGTSSNGNVATGYLKNYNYDSRLQYNPPPFLADLASTAWQRASFAEGTP
jgi:hypothetical protein